MIFEKIIQWNEQRNNKEFNSESEYKMLKEELAEFLEAKDEYEMVDALCDLIVIATGAIHKLGYSPKLAMLETLQEINSRQQDPLQAMSWRMEGPDGKWQKWKDQPKDTLYKAQYEHYKYYGVNVTPSHIKEQLEEMRNDMLQETP